MLRASSIAALESVREELSPREIDAQYLRGVLANEGDGAPFMNAKVDVAVNAPLSWRCWNRAPLERYPDRRNRLGIHNVGLL